MKKIKYLISGMVLCVVMSGCAMSMWTKLENKEYSDGSRAFKAIMPQDWMRLNYDRDFVLTHDGLALNLINVHRINQKNPLEFTKKKYADNMMITDLAEIESDNLKMNTNMLQFSVLSNTPIDISGREAYRIEYQYENKNGLPISGIQCGFQHKQWIYRIKYEAASQHYFSSLKSDFEAFLKSFQTI
ncbi:MAG: hypothetical protein HQL25_05660 [Candidatus Omnitrophica bacterium]|nr:hypothetical protein [Candidatus Omnitrophota bacterium]